MKAKSLIRGGELEGGLGDLGGGADDGGPAAWQHDETGGLRIHICRVLMVVVVVVVAADTLPSNG
jgi:hypothetical protein